jgi:hypothetical protein
MIYLPMKNFYSIRNNKFNLTMISYKVLQIKANNKLLKQIIKIFNQRIISKILNIIIRSHKIIFIN